MHLIHINIVVSGKVQGVWFRASARNKAREIGVFGYVKNLDDGKVYIEAEGSEEQLKTFVEWCKNGPELARVDAVEVQNGVLKNYHHFEIER